MGSRLFVPSIYGIIYMRGNRTGRVIFPSGFFLKLL